MSVAVCVLCRRQVLIKHKLKSQTMMRTGEQVSLVDCLWTVCMPSGVHFWSGCTQKVEVMRMLRVQPLEY